MPKGYVIVNANVTDTSKYDAYRPLSAAAVAAYGGTFIVRGGQQEVVEGQTHTRTVVIEFDSFEQAKAFYHSPEYTQAREVRAGAAQANIVCVEGA